MPAEFIDMNLRINEDESRTALITLVGEKWRTRENSLEAAIANS